MTTKAHRHPEIDLAKAAGLAKEWTYRRDKMIREDTRSLRVIAAEAGLSHTAVAKIRAKENR